MDQQNVKEGNLDRPSGEEIAAFMARHSITQAQMAQRAGIGLRTLIRYLRGGTANAHAPQVKVLNDFMRRVDRRKGGAQNEKAE